MDNKDWPGENVAVHIPLKSPYEDETKVDENPPPYEHPRVDLSSGWKDRGFAIAFWIHAAIVIILGLVLGVPAIIPLIKGINVFGKTLIEDHYKTNQTSLNIEVKSIILGLSSGSATAVLSSFVIFFVLQQCASHFIKCSFIILILMQILIGVGLCFVFWPLCFMPGIFLLIISISLCCIRKRISFAEAHLRAGCAALRSHPSLILITIIVIVIQFIWFIFWFLMAFGITRVVMNSSSINTNETMNNTIGFNINNAKSTPIMTTTSFYDENIKNSDGTMYSMRERQRRMNKTIYEVDEQRKNVSRQGNSTSQDKQLNKYTESILGFILLLSWYWGSITLGNIAHFITACMVGQWWFSNENNQQYSMRNSVKRAFTVSFGTICFGSFFEALIKAVRRSTEDSRNRNKSLVACIIGCILNILERIVGYLNEWAFIFAALTGQGFVQASKSFIELFKKRGWTVIINDTLIGGTLMLINIGIAILSATIGGLTIYFMTNKPFEQYIFNLIITIILSFIFALLLSSVVTTILIACVRTVLVCFALNPAALGATHPDHLQSLTKVWHKFYPQEFSTSGYANQFKDTGDYL